MTQKVNVKTNYKELVDADAIAIAGAVIKGVYVEKVIPAPPPFDQTTVQKAIDELGVTITALAKAGGGKVLTSLKNKNRNELNGLLRKLAHYVQLNCNDDAQLVLNTGFQVKAKAVRSGLPLDKAEIISVANGQAKELVITVKKVLRAKSYEAEAAAVGPNNTVGPFQPAGVFTKSRMTITGLQPGTVYAIQVRAKGGPTGSGDWSDAVSQIVV
jgi:hypothetical protein